MSAPADVPTPVDLITLSAHELAIVAAADVLLQALVSSVVAANPELLDDDLFGDCRMQRPLVFVADSIVTSARALQAQLARYRLAILLADQRQREQLRELPF